MRRPPVLPPLHRGPALHMKAPATRTGAVLRLRRQAAWRARMASIWRMASAFTAGRSVRPRWRSDVAPLIRQGEQHHNLGTFNPQQPLFEGSVTPGDIRRDRDSEGRATPLPSRDLRHRAPAVARPPRSREPPQPPDPFSRPLATANPAAAQFSAAMQLDRPSCALMLPHRVRSEPCKVLVALPCVPV